MIALSLLLACSGDKSDDTGAAAPSIEILHPTADDSLAIGPFSVTVLVEDFALEAPAKHNEGEPEGYISVSLDGVEVLTTAETTFSVSTDAAGTYTLAVELRYADGDALEPPVTDEVALAIE
ncbi:MAG: hypothetical protein Q8P41_11085 [Pseudomonadota bacterium]|nr:hypothetical protein [Pseudomonadota bacterium]